jgi:hypothetical protein
MKKPLSEDDSLSQALKLKKLTPEQMQRIDAVLDSLGKYGEVHLIVQNGELRYIRTVQSFKAGYDEQKE